jgi:peptide/nickel transport system ATP-binding protein
MYEMQEKVYDIAKMPMDTMRMIRGREIAMIFQEPMTSLNPVFTIGNQLDEVAFLHIEGISKENAKKRSIEMLNLVGIADPEGVYKKFPHELSGGMRQRVMIAMSLLCNPRLIIADEPTTALDVTIQAQILDLLREIKDKISGSIMLITHDLGVVAEMADYVVVMYAGKVIEMGTAEDIFDRPMHPYTIGLQKSKPTVDEEVESLYCIPGFVPNPVDMPNYCYFRDRCERCKKECAGAYPELVQVTPTHSVSCYLYKEPTLGMNTNDAATEPSVDAVESVAIAEQMQMDIDAAVETISHTEENTAEKSQSKKKKASKKEKKAQKAANKLAKKNAKKEKKAKKRKGKKSLPDIVEEKDDKQEDIA